MVNPPPVIIETHDSLHLPMSAWYFRWGLFALKLGLYHALKKHLPFVPWSMPSKPKKLTAHPMVKK